MAPWSNMRSQHLYIINDRLKGATELGFWSAIAWRNADNSAIIPVPTKPDRPPHLEARPTS